VPPQTAGTTSAIPTLLLFPVLNLQTPLGPQIGSIRSGKLECASPDGATGQCACCEILTSAFTECSFVLTFPAPWAISANLLGSDGEVPTRPSSRDLAKLARNNALQLQGFQQEMPDRFGRAFWASLQATISPKLLIYLATELPHLLSRCTL
jgi:hypothetical protein